MQKIKHLLYKEWLKTSWSILLALISTLGGILTVFFTVRSGFISAGGVNYVSNLLTYKVAFFSLYRYLPLLVALFIGVSQFVPEVLNKRIKLTFHLPVKPLGAVYIMVIYGFLIQVAIQLIGMLLYASLLSIYFPIEIIGPSLSTIFPWILGGITAYFFIAMIAMEPVWKFRFLYILVCFQVLSLYFGNYAIGNAVTLYPVLFIITGIASLSPIYTSWRFNKGEI